MSYQQVRLALLGKGAHKARSLGNLGRTGAVVHRVRSAIMGVFQLQRAGKLVSRTHPEQAKTLGGRNLTQRLGLRALQLGAARGA